MKSKLYKPIDVWKRIEPAGAIRFRCFEIIGENKYCVQSVDYYYLPISGENHKQLENQFIELFIEVPPEERDDVYSTLEEAIFQFEKDF